MQTFMNLKGILPYEVLDYNNEEFIANAFLSNVKQLGEQVKANRELTVGKSIVNTFWKDKEFNEKLIQSEKLLEKKSFKQSIYKTQDAAKVGKETLTYYRRYQTDRFLLCLMLMWICWITLLFVDLSGIPRQNIQLAHYSWMHLANFALIVLVIPLIIEYAGERIKMK